MLCSGQYGILEENERSTKWGTPPKGCQSHFVLFSFHRIDVLRASVLVTVVGSALEGRESNEIKWQDSAAKTRSDLS
ncbi:hypothetical protein KL86SPO_50704 [uncultured Sporomusa sp.]|uniref:Uncharacterized protein n=1 Tax=uncultured Sporomusa sp. TaxID=307249 RepID=A0A212LZG4_9FIRM|nr:hypothetical protein KL86SPO_50704 [uncultured Sporomusa sp.]